MSLCSSRNNKKTKRIAFDIDNVLNSLAEAVLEVYNKDFDDNLKIEDITDYYMEKFVKEEAKEVFHLYFTDKRVWKKIKVIKATQECINRLVDDGIEVYFATATEPYNVPKKANWLQRNFPNIDIRKRLISIHDKFLLSGIDILVDDYYKNLDTDSYKGILIDYPWNRNVELRSNVARVLETDDLYKCIKSVIRPKNYVVDICKGDYTISEVKCGYCNKGLAFSCSYRFLDEDARKYHCNCCEE